MKIREALDNPESLKRPAWTSGDLEAYRHKHQHGQMIEGYYVKTKGKQ